MKKRICVVLAVYFGFCCAFFGSIFLIAVYLISYLDPTFNRWDAFIFAQIFIMGLCSLGSLIPLLISLTVKIEIDSIKPNVFAKKILWSSINQISLFRVFGIKLSTTLLISSDQKQVAVFLFYFRDGDQVISRLQAELPWFNPTIASFSGVQIYRRD